jgi:hypothetical protein
MKKLVWARALLVFFIIFTVASSGNYGHWLEKFYEPFPYHRLLGYFFAALSGLCLIVAIHLNWNGYSGMFWLLAFMFGFVGAHELTALEGK